MRPVERTMSQVTVTINGRQFRMACEDGQESHLLRLAHDLDQRIDKLRITFGEIGDTRLTVMAALTVADELADTSGKLRRLEEDLAALQDARAASAERSDATQAAGRGRAQLRRRAHRAGDQGAQSQPHRRRHARMRRRAQSGQGIGLPGYRLRVAPGPCPHYIGEAGLRGALGALSPGPYRSHGSCPCPGSWVRAHGAHLLA